MRERLKTPRWARDDGGRGLLMPMYGRDGEINLQSHGFDALRRSHAHLFPRFGTGETTHQSAPVGEFVPGEIDTSILDPIRDRLRQAAHQRPSVGIETS